MPDAPPNSDSVNGRSNSPEETSNVTVTSKLSPGLPAAHARETVRDYLAWQPLPVDRAVVERAWALMDFSLSFWDALIVNPFHGGEA